MRFIVSRQERPASTRMLVSELERTVLLPFDPEASTVMRTAMMLREYPDLAVEK
jgi:hypothetical protein